MKMQGTHMNPVLNMSKNSLIDLPTPSSISFMWNMGFLLGMTLILQTISGLILSMLYTPEVSYAFSNMVKISQDVSVGWLTQKIHANGASLFFLLLYIHTARGIFFNSTTNQKNTWMSGSLILLAVMATAFLGYVLPWGQMSFWGATVITGVLSAIPVVGTQLVKWIWGGPSVSGPTLNRFFSLHFILPMIIMGMAMAHLILLHEKGSSNPTSTQLNLEKVKFSPLFLVKDTLPLILISITLMTLISTSPNLLGDVENYNPANPLVAPLHIQPEWYFLFAYAILRSIPSKLGGVAALVMSVLILLTLPLGSSKRSKYSPQSKVKFWSLVSVILILTWIGGEPVEDPYENIGKAYTMAYFILMSNLN